GEFQRLSQEPTLQGLTRISPHCMSHCPSGVCSSIALLSPAAHSLLRYVKRGRRPLWRVLWYRLKHCCLLSLSTSQIRTLRLINVLLPRPNSARKCVHA
ncbi:Hypothetical predicted protein, partial [Pelobates cultripes]